MIMPSTSAIGAAEQANNLKSVRMD